VTLHAFRPRARGFALAAALLVLTGAGVSTLPAVAAVAAPAAAATIRIDNFVFGPAVLTVKAGSTVTWVNNDDTAHTVVSTGGAFRSAALDTGDRFSFAFAKPGEYPYFCSLHPHMTGKVVVTPR
jgi:plastocyanin